jgi:enolase
MASATRITAVTAREVLDSRGTPTVEVQIECGRAIGRAIVPSGASTGRWEAVELRDGDSRRFAGQGVRKAVEQVRRVLAPAVVGRDAADQRRLDLELCALDATDDKSRLGANAILAVSLAAAHAAAAARHVPLVQHLHDLWRHSLSDTTPAAARARGGMSLPLPMVNMISGGRHAGGQLDFQDYLVLPVGAASYGQALEWTCAVYRALGRQLRDAGFEGVLVGDEGGFGPRLPDNEAALKILVSAVNAAGLRPGTEVALGLDVASTHFYHDGEYRLHCEQGRRLSSAGMVHLLAGYVERYPIVSIEDALAEDDWEGWELLTRTLGGRVQLIGDDLFTTSVARIRDGVARGVANSVLIKLNQVGTLWETLEALHVSVESGYRPVVSARSGETEDTTIADLAVATGAGQIKIGSVARSERLAKYNQLLRLEELLGGEAPFAGGAALARPGPASAPAGRETAP